MGGHHEATARTHPHRSREETSVTPEANALIAEIRREHGDRVADRVKHWILNGPDPDHEGIDSRGPEVVGVKDRAYPPIPAFNREQTRRYREGRAQR
jgi:hypothetical protein